MKYHQHHQKPEHYLLVHFNSVLKSVNMASKLMNQVVPHANVMILVEGNNLLFYFLSKANFSYENRNNFRLMIINNFLFHLDIHVRMIKNVLYIVKMVVLIFFVQLHQNVVQKKFTRAHVQQVHLSVMKMAMQSRALQ